MRIQRKIKFIYLFLAAGGLLQTGHVFANSTIASEEINATSSFTPSGGIIPGTEEQPEFKALKESIKQAQAITESTRSSDLKKQLKAAEALTNESTQVELQQAKTKLDKEIDLNTLKFTSEQIEPLYYGYYPNTTEYQGLLQYDAFGILQSELAKLLEVYDKEPYQTPADLSAKSTWATAELDTCIALTNTSLKDNSKTLKGLLETIEKTSSKYSSLKGKEPYQIVSKWQYNGHSNSKYFEYNKEKRVIKVGEIYYYGSTSLENCNLRIIIEKLSLLQKQMNWIDSKAEYTTILGSHLKTLNKYFAEEEQNASTESWNKVNSMIQQCQNLIQNDTPSPEEKAQIQQALSGIQSEVNQLDQAWATARGALQEGIGTANKLLICYQVTDDVYKQLTPAIAEAEEQYNNTEDRIISNYTKATSALNDVYITAKESYDQEVAKLSTLISEVTTGYEAWGSKEIQSDFVNGPLALANDDLDNAKKTNLNVTKIAERITSLTDSYKLSGHKDKAITVAAELKKLQDTYGDEGDTIETLINKVKSVELATADAVWKEVDDRTAKVLKDYNDILGKLTNLILAANSYCDNWPNIEGINELQAAASKTQTEVIDKEVKNIADLNKAYDDLFKVYDAKGGTSDPIIYKKELESLIEKAKAEQTKYNYSSLQQAINEARSYYENSNITYELQAQKIALQAEMDRTIKQYKLLVVRMDKEMVNTNRVLTQRYDAAFPSEVKERLAAIAQHLEVSTEEERACTDMQLLLGEERELKQIATDAEKAWSDAVAKFEKVTNDAALKFDQNFFNSEDLKKAVRDAKEVLKEINGENKNYITIASVEAAQKALDDVLVKVEATDRKNIAKLFIKDYSIIKEQFDLYGSDEKSSPTSGVKSFINDRAALYQELSDLDKPVKYSIEELTNFYQEAEQVLVDYKLFCDKAEILKKDIAAAELDNAKYYANAEGTDLDKALIKARWASEESLSLDSIEKQTYKLHDAVIATTRVYDQKNSQLRSARDKAQNSHNRYYGKEVTSSEILKVYEESEATLKETNIFTIGDMVVKLQNCTKAAEQTCKEKSEALTVIINDADSLNVVMEDVRYDDSIAVAINAQHAAEARIKAIDQATVALKALNASYTEQYQQAVEALKASLAKAEEVIELTKNAELKELVEVSDTLTERTNPITPKSPKLKAINNAQQKVSALSLEIENAWNKQCEALQAELVEARAKALEMHNLYYGKATKKSEILTVYAEAEQFLNSKDLESTQAMVDKLNASYMQASIESATLEADLHNVVNNLMPLVKLMEAPSISKAIEKAEAQLEVKDALLEALKGAIEELTAIYDERAGLYDQAVVALSDTLAAARDLSLQMRDEALQEAITKAEKAFNGADKTKETATLYADLRLQITILAGENKRVREALEATGIEALEAEKQEGILYSISGMPMKKVNLVDKESLKGVPEGIYILNGKKIVIGFIH